MAYRSDSAVLSIIFLLILCVLLVDFTNTVMGNKHISAAFLLRQNRFLNQTGNFFLLFDENVSHRLQIYFMLNSIK